MKTYVRHALSAATVSACLLAPAVLWSGTAHAALPNRSCGTITSADTATANRLSPLLTGKLSNHLTSYRLSCAKAIVNEVEHRGLSKRAAVIAVTTAITESALENNPNKLDHTSVGLFQQQDWWGSFEQRLDPAYSTDAFLNAMLKAYPGNSWESAQIGAVCQKVQVSAFPNAYQPNAVDAQRITDALYGTTETGALLAASVSGDVARVGLVGSDGALYSTEANYGVGQWTPRGWARQDGAGLSNLASVTVGGVQHVYGIGGDGKVFMKDQNLDSGQWSPWYEVPGGAGGARGLTVAAVGNGAWLSIIGSDGALYTTTVDYAGGGWAGVWTRQDGAGLTSLASTVVDNVLHLYGIGGDGKVFIKDRNLESGAWSPWVEVLGGASGARGITAAVTGRAARVNIIGSDGTLYTTTADYAAGQWTGSWVQVDRSPVRSVASVAIGNVVHVYGVGMDGRIYTIDADYNIGRWLGTWAEVPGGAVA